MNTVRMLSRKDIEGYTRLVRSGYLEAELEGIHYSAYSKPYENLMEWLIKIPTWGLFNENNVLIAALSLQFGWHRCDKDIRKTGLILFRHGVVAPYFKGQGCFQYLFRWIENNILKRVMRANSVFLETNMRFSKFEHLYLKKLGMRISDKYECNSGCILLEKDYKYNFVPDTMDYDDTYDFFDLVIRMLTEKDYKEYCSLLRIGSRSSLAEGIDYSFGHVTEEKCHKMLIELPTWGLFGASGQLVCVGSFEFPWQLTCSNKQRKHVFLRHGVMLKNYYKDLIKSNKLELYRRNWNCHVFNAGARFSLYNLLLGYIIDYYLLNMLKCNIIFSDTAYGSQAMNIETRDWGMEIIEHIYSYKSTPHAVLLKKHFAYE